MPFLRRTLEEGVASSPSAREAIKGSRHILKKNYFEDLIMIKVNVHAQLTMHATLPCLPILLHSSLSSIVKTLNFTYQTITKCSTPATCLASLSKILVDIVTQSFCTFEVVFLIFSADSRLPRQYRGAQFHVHTYSNLYPLHICI